MEIVKWQKVVDDWIKEYGVRYFDEKTNALLLVEEVGELVRHIARNFGEQSYKSETDANESLRKIGDEIGDIIFVLTCLSNQMNIDLESILKENMKKKTNRDHQRHKLNEKLNKE